MFPVRIYTRVNANIAKCKVIVPVMDGFRRYGHARVIADLTNMTDYHEERTLIKSTRRPLRRLLRMQAMKYGAG